jgi:hypothetical protein
MCVGYMCLHPKCRFVLHLYYKTRNTGNSVHHNFLLIKQIALFYDLPTCFGGFVKNAEKNSTKKV